MCVMNLRGRGKNQVWPNLRYYADTSIYLEGPGKPPETSVNKTVLRAEAQQNM
jgi:hypothetical protein